MQFEDAVEIISEMFRINQWSSNEYGERHAVIDDDIEIRMFSSSSDMLTLQGLFGEQISGTSQMSANESKLKYLLQSNFIRIINHDDVLSIDNRTDRLCNTRNLSLHSATAEFILENVESFIQNVDFWDVISKKKQSFSTMSPLLGLFGRR